MSKPDSQPKVLYQAKRFRVEERTQIANDGSRLIRHVVVHPGAVVVLPLLGDDRVCLIRNERVAVGKTLIELPAGTLDHDQSPLETAMRELQEETGYQAKTWRELHGFFMSPGILNERMHVFVAEDLSEGAPAREQGENIDNLIVRWSEAMEMVDRGEIEDAKSLATLLLWERLGGPANSPA